MKLYKLIAIPLLFLTMGVFSQSLPTPFETINRGTLRPSELPADGEWRVWDKVNVTFSAINDSLTNIRADVNPNTDSITALRTDINTNIDSVAALRTDINTNIDSVAALRTDINTNTASISTNSTAISAGTYSLLLTDTTEFHTYGSGNGVAGDTIAFAVGSTLGVKYHLKDTLIITDLVTSLSTGDTLDIVIVYNDTAWVNGDTLYSGAVDTLTNTISQFTATKVPPGNAVWMNVTAVTILRKPIKFYATLFGYLKRD